MQFELTAGEPHRIKPEFGAGLPLVNGLLPSRSRLPDGAIRVAVVDRGNNELERPAIEGLRVTCSSAHIAQEQDEHTAVLQDDNWFSFEAMTVQKSSQSGQCTVAFDAKYPSQLSTTYATVGSGFAASNWVTQAELRLEGNASLNTSSNLPLLKLLLATEDRRPVDHLLPIGQSTMRCGPSVAGAFLRAVIDGHDLAFKLTDLGYIDPLEAHVLQLEFDADQGFNVFEKALAGPVKLQITYTEPRPIRDVLRTEERTCTSILTFEPGPDDESPVLKFVESKKELFLSDLEQMGKLRYRLHSGTGKAATEFIVKLEATDRLGLPLGSTQQRSLNVQLSLSHQGNDPQAFGQPIPVNGNGVAQLPTDFFKNTCFKAGLPQMLVPDVPHLIGATLHGLQTEASASLPLTFTYTSDANIQELLSSRTELLERLQQFVESFNLKMEELKSASAVCHKASQSLVRKQSQLRSKFDDGAAMTIQEVTDKLQQTDSQLKQLKKEHESANERVILANLNLQRAPRLEGEAIGFVHQLFHCEDAQLNTLLARYIGSHMNVLVVLTTEYGRGHFDGSRLIVAELDQLAPGMFRTPATWPMLPHLERANWKPTNQFDPNTPLESRFTASWALDHITIQPPLHMAGALLAVKKQELEQLKRHGGGYSQEINRTEKEIATLDSNDWGDADEPGNAQILCSTYLRKTIFARLIGDAVVLPTKTDAETYSKSLNSRPTLITKDGHEFHLGAFRGTTAMANVEVDKFDQANTAKRLHEMYNLQDDVNKFDDLKTLIEDHEQARKDTTTAETTIGPFKLRMESIESDTVKLEKVNSVIVLKLQGRKHSYGTRGEKTTDDQDKVPEIKKLKEDLNKLAAAVNMQPMPMMPTGQSSGQGSSSTHAHEPSCAEGEGSSPAAKRRRKS